MEIEILNKISSSTISGYYDPSIKLIAVWFHNTQDDNKLDLVAYLQHNMVWSLREITNEESTLYKDKETIIITHNPIGEFEKDSNFDKMIREILSQTMERLDKEGVRSVELDIMKTVLTNSEYDDRII